MSGAGAKLPGASNTSARLDAGEFSQWLRDMRAAIRGTRGMDVACGECRGCCSSSMYVKIRPEDIGARRRIPAESLIAMPEKTDAYLLRYDAQGLCHMLEHGNCRIYEDRPQTCRDYDCRIFTAAGIVPGDARKQTINERVARWQFSYADDAARREHAAVAAAARFLKRNAEDFPNADSLNHTAIAVMAVKAYALFLVEPAQERTNTAEVTRAFVQACGDFDAS
jgi:Fe-S-cluster containining protein